MVKRASVAKMTPYLHFAVFWEMTIFHCFFFEKDMIQGVEVGIICGLGIGTQCIEKNGKILQTFIWVVLRILEYLNQDHMPHSVLAFPAHTRSAVRVALSTSGTPWHQTWHLLRTAGLHMDSTWMGRQFLSAEVPSFRQASSVQLRRRSFPRKRMVEPNIWLWLEGLNNHK